MATTRIVTARLADKSISLLLKLTNNTSLEIINISTFICYNRRFYDQNVIKSSMTCKQENGTARKYYFSKKTNYDGHRTGLHGGEYKSLLQNLLKKYVGC